MAIKWEDVHIRVGGLTNEIYVGKLKKDRVGYELFKDKSHPMTQECIKAVMEHMIGEIKENGTMSYVIEGVCELRITDLRAKE